MIEERQVDEDALSMNEIARVAGRLPERHAVRVVAHERAAPRPLVL